MTAKRLGKGISAIIPEFPEGIESVRQIVEIDINKIKTNRNQPRKQFDGQAMQELENSVRRHGILQPITVRQTEEGFELIAGERRLRAARAVELEDIPAYVLPVESDAEQMEYALIENIQREDLNPIEEAQAYLTLAQTFDLSHEEISERVGKKRSTITNTMRLLNLPAPIIKDLQEGGLSAGHARPLLNLENEQQQLNLWRRIKAEGLSVRAVESLAKKVKPHRSVRPAKPQSRAKPPAVKGLEDRLMHIIGSRVRLKGSQQQGRIEIEYYSADDLARLVEIFETLEETNP